MTKRLKDAITKCSEIRTALNALAEDAAEEERAGLVDHLTAAETELREATAAEPSEADPLTVEPDSAERERREIRARCSIARWLTGTVVDGPEAELVAAECAPGQLPVSMLFGPPPAPSPEERAAATVAAAAVAENVMPTAQQVFVSPLAARLGIMTPTVRAGESAFPYVMTGVSAAAVAAGDDIGDSSPKILAKSAGNRRVSATFDYQREDSAKLGDLDAVLTDNLRQGLADEFDRQITVGDNAAPNLNGLLTQIPATDPGDNMVTDFKKLTALVAEFVDGLYAESYGEVRLLTSPRVAHFLKSLLPSANTLDDALAWLARTFAGEPGISRRVPTIAAVDNATPADRRAAGGGLWGIRTGVPSLAYAPIWSGIDLVRDEITGAKKGTVTVTAYLLAGGVVIVRPDAYTVATVQTEAGVAP